VTKIKTISYIVLVGSFLITTLAASASQLADAELQAKLEERLKKEKRLKDRVRVSVEDGVVTLSGLVTNIWSKKRAIELAMEIPESQAVESEMEIARAESDQALADEVAKMVLSYVFYTIFDAVNVSVQDGVVHLAGRVTWGHKVDDIEKKASQSFGAQEVINEIEELPTSIQDQRLRQALAHRIYGDPIFVDQAFGANPPIHIVVERGHVTLLGVVRSNVEKRKAEVIARSTFRVFSVENKLVSGS